LHELRMASDYGFPLKEFYFTEKGRRLLEAELPGSADALPCFELSEPAFQKISQREHPEGVLALVDQPELQSLDTADPEELTLILENLEKPGNVGAILRSAAAFGFRQIVFNHGSVDPYHPHTIRNSRGHSLGMRYYRETPEGTVNWLKTHCIHSYLATPHTDRQLHEVEFQRPLVWIFGTEHDGVSDFWMEQATEKIRIPMHSSVDSLNVSVSASIVLYEVFKQVSGLPMSPKATP